MKTDEIQRLMKEHIITGGGIALSTGGLAGLLAASYQQWEPAQQYTMLGLVGAGVVATGMQGYRIYRLATWAGSTKVPLRENSKPTPDPQDAATESLEGRVLYLTKKKEGKRKG